MVLGRGTSGSASGRRTPLGLIIAIGLLLLLDGTALAVIDGDLGPAAAQAGQVPTTSSTTPPNIPSTSAPAVSVPASLLVSDKEVIIFLQPAATERQVDVVRQRLARMTDLASVRFVDKPEAYSEMKTLLAGHPELIAAIDPVDAPVNFHVLPKPNVDRRVVGARLAGYPGVLKIAYPRATGPRTFP